MNGISHIRGTTFHGRRGAVENTFRYSIDYVCLDLDARDGPAFFSRDRGNLFSIRTRDHGGAPKAGQGTKWVRQVLGAHQLNPDGAIFLLAQPRVLGHVFNPVSFWFCLDRDGDPRAVIAEVSNTFGDRHSYLCHHPDGGKIDPSDELTAHKVFHVSPFQPVEGDYTFRFDFRADRIGIWINYSRENGGVFATLTGPRQPLTNRAILGALLRRPFGARRVLALIHWQAIKLWWKGARYRVRPAPPNKDVTD